jgi:uncharacterized membrane protein (UPF0127 family)
MNRLLRTILISIIIILGCTAYYNDSTTAFDHTMHITLPNGQIINIEIADTDEKRATGLMFRKDLPYSSGMLFIFDTEDFHSFWMKNTLIPLDILWLDKDFRIRYYYQNVQPCKSDPCASYSPLIKAVYVLEVNAGFIKKENLKLDDKLKPETAR